MTSISKATIAAFGFAATSLASQAQQDATRLVRPSDIPHATSAPQEEPNVADFISGRKDSAKFFSRSNPDEQADKRKTTQGKSSNGR
jgi:hypothetical protein